MVGRPRPTPCPRYFEGAQFVHFLPGPAIVALALPLHRELKRERAQAFEMGETAGAFAGPGMGLNAVVTSILVPLLARWILP